MTKNDITVLNHRIDRAVSLMVTDRFTWPVDLLHDCQEAIRKLYIEKLKHEAQACGLRQPILQMMGTDASRKELEELYSRRIAIQEELKSLGA